MIDPRRALITAKSAHGIARTSPRRLGTPAWPGFFRGWVPRTHFVFLLFCSSSIPSLIQNVFLRAVPSCLANNLFVGNQKDFHSWRETKLLEGRDLNETGVRTFKSNSVKMVFFTNVPVILECSTLLKRLVLNLYLSSRIKIWVAHTVGHFVLRQVGVAVGLRLRVQKQSRSFAHKHLNQLSDHDHLRSPVFRLHLQDCAQCTLTDSLLCAQDSFASQAFILVPILFIRFVLFRWLQNTGWRVTFLHVRRGLQAGRSSPQQCGCIRCALCSEFSGLF